MTPGWLFVKIPASFAISAAPVQAVTGSAFPVMEKPLSRNSTPDAPNEKQGAPVTSQVTSPVRSVSSTMTYVRVMRPLTLSAAEGAEPTPTTTARGINSDSLDQLGSRHRSDLQIADTEPLGIDGDHSLTRIPWANWLTPCLGGFRDVC